MSPNPTEEREHAISRVLAKLFIADEDADDQERQELTALEEYWQNQRGGLHERMTIRDVSAHADQLVSNCEKNVTMEWIKQFKGVMLNTIEDLKQANDSQLPSSSRPRNATPTFSDRSSVSTDSEVLGKIEL